jgi:3',5'-cyclic AMP phosphodiesterase CpdA
MSLETIVLRFYDFDYETIKEHLKIIDEKNFVWWAWWKKIQERWQGRALEEVASRCPIKIGLVNRTAKEFYEAKCEKVVFETSGSRIPSPDGEFTPNYYRHSIHPAWFKISSIEKIGEDDFERYFAEIPKGEPTLFVVERKSSGLVLLDEEVREPNTVKTRGDAILHLSDIHFGEDHGYPSVTKKSPTTAYSLAHTIGAIVESLGGINIGMVVLSGDLLTRGDPEGYVVAQNFLNDLLVKLRLGKEHVIIVPGNHDIAISDFQTAPYQYEPEDPYRNFLKSFYGGGENRIERFQHFLSPAGWTMNFLSLNSSSIRKKDFMDYGYVGRDKYEPFLRILDNVNGERNAAELMAAKVLNFVVLHHHILPVQDVDLPEPERPVSIMLDAGQLVSSFQSSNIHFVLHGHQHVPFIGSTARVRRLKGAWLGCETPLTVLGSGSSGAKVERLFNVMRNNTLSIYTPKEDGLSILIQQFNPGISSEPYIDLKIPTVTAPKLKRKGKKLLRRIWRES